MRSLHRYFAATAAVFACVAPAAAQDPQLVAPTEALSPREQAAKFRLPPGFKIELVASEPETPKPININFDARGRLLVTCSVEYPFPAGEGQPHRDTIKLISDTNGDGVPDKVTTFADGLNIPIGVTAVADGVLGYSIPNLYRFPDKDEDGTADGREVAYTRFGFDDTHGMASSLAWWVDGWVYACHGFRNTSTVRGADDESVTMQSGNTYRLRPDGSHIEQWTWGQVNPFGLTFDPLGNAYTSDCHSRPLYMLVRGAHYPSFGKPHDGLGYGPEMMTHSHNSTGIAGAVWYGADQFPEAYRGTMFVGNPVTGIVNHDRIEWRGSSPWAVELPDFLKCEDPWFRPVDLKVGPDGALYVADFYNKIIGHYEVDLKHPGRDRERGRIWRISYVGKEGEAPSGTKARDLTSATVEQLIEALGHPNLVVRTHATHQLVHRIGESAADAVRARITGEGSSAEQRAHGLWVLARLGGLDLDLVRRFAGDPDRLVRVHLVRSLAERPEWSEDERRVVLEAMKDADPFARRVAADAAGRHPHPENVEPLLALWAATPSEDAQLVHTLRISLRDTLAGTKNLTELAARYSDAPRAMEQLAEVCVGLPTPQSAEFLLTYCETRQPPQGRLAETLHQIVRHLDEGQLPRAWRLVTTIRERDKDTQRHVLRQANRARQERGVPLPGDLQVWATELANGLLSAGDEGTVRNGIELARELGLKGTGDALARLALGNSKLPNLRGDALGTLVGIDRPAALTALGNVLASGSEEVALRQSAADSLGSLNTPESREVLAAQLKSAPQGVAAAIGRALAGSREGADVLLASVEKGTASPRLLQDAAVRERLQASGLDGLEPRLAKLLEGLPQADERLQELIAQRKAGFTAARADLTAGAAAFKKTCAACHRVGNEGAKVGPELDGIGLRGADRLLEDVLDPNRNVDGAFRATVVALTDGRVMTGLVLREEGQVLVLVDDKGKEHRIPTEEIEERRQSKLSPMPANVAEQLGEPEFYHLLGFLLDQRRKPEAGSASAGR